MTDQPTDLPGNAGPARHAGAPPAGWARPLAIAAAAVFLVSSVFPLVAGFIKDTESWPKWWGTLDVAVAFLLALVAFVIAGLTQGKVTKKAREASYRAYRALAYGLPAIFIVYYLFGDSIIWSQCLPGFAWRTWLLVYSLPAWLTLLAI
jgi:hypothetical protein